MIGSLNDEVTPREFSTWQHERQMFELEAEHRQKMKDKELELAKLEAKWSSWLAIPKTIIMVPILLIFGLAYIVSIITKKEVPEAYWDFLKR